jgi:hypothetical protein
MDLYEKILISFEAAQRGYDKKITHYDKKITDYFYVIHDYSFIFL